MDDVGRKQTDFLAEKSENNYKSNLICARFHTFTAACFSEYKQTTTATTTRGYVANEEKREKR